MSCGLEPWCRVPVTCTYAWPAPDCDVHNDDDHHHDADNIDDDGDDDSNDADDRWFLFFYRKSYSILLFCDKVDIYVSLLIECDFCYSLTKICQRVWQL